MASEKEKDLKKTYKLREKIFKAMAHASRLIILTSLHKSEKCVCELVDLIGDDPSTISKHLSVLKNAGIVDDDKRGLKVYYRLTCPCVIEYIECIEKVVRKNTRA